MFPEMIVAIGAFLGLVVAWIVLPVRNRSQREESPSEAELA